MPVWLSFPFRVVLVLALLVPAALHADVDIDDPEGVGSEMGYRLFGKAKKNKPLLLQNSRPFPVQVFENVRGIYVDIPAYSDRTFPCKGRSRLLHVRFVDQFGESSPFQVKISCGRELQFIAKQQVSTPAMGVKIPARPKSVEDVASEPGTSAPAATPAPAADEPPPPFLSPVR